MGNFNGGKRTTGTWRSNDRGGFGGDRGERPEMHSATCASCGNDCQVPFKPNGKKPIFCRNCFKKDDDESSYDRPRNDRPSYDKPSYDRPNYDKPAFKKPYQAPAAAPAQNNEQFERLIVKMDQILKVLLVLTAPLAEQAKVAPAKVVAAPAEAVEAPVKKVKKAKKAA